MLILRTLQWGPQHGYAIGQTIRAQSSEVLQVETGSLYPALQRLAKTGGSSPNGTQTEANQRAKYYRLTPRARSNCCANRRDGRELVAAIGRILNPRIRPRSGRLAARSKRMARFHWLARRRQDDETCRRRFAAISRWPPGPDRGRRRPRGRAPGGAEGVRQRHAHDRGRAAGLARPVGGRTRRPRAGRAVRRPAARQEPGLMRSSSSPCWRSGSARMPPCSRSSRASR